MCKLAFDILKRPISELLVLIYCSPSDSYYLYAHARRYV